MHLEKEMATHSSVLAWRIPGTGEPGELPSMVSHRVEHNWSDLVLSSNAILPNHPTLSLSQSPKDCSIHLCLLLSRIQGYGYHLAKSHIYALVYCISVFLSGLLHSIIGSSFNHLIRSDSNVFFFNGWIIFHCVYVPQLSYPFICWWTSRLLPCPINYWKKNVYLPTWS